MKRKTVFRFFLLIAVSMMAFNSCKKEDPIPADDDTGGASDNSLAERSFADVTNIADQADSDTLSSYIIGSNELGARSSCATVTRDTTTVPRTITIDFGTSNCLCNDGRYRRGKINISYYGQYRDSASVHTITFTDYFVNDNQILGSKTVTNNGHNSLGNLTFSIYVNGQIIKSGGGTITWVSNRVREWVTGESTATRSDDVYLISGTASGTTANGTAFNATIISRLRVELSCNYIVSGSFSFEPTGKPIRTIDFGSGACDNQATVTINGNVYNYTLH